MRKQCYPENSNHLDSLNVNEGITLNKTGLKKNWLKLYGSGWETVAGSCEHGNKMRGNSGLIESSTNRFSRITVSMKSAVFCVLKIQPIRNVSEQGSSPDRKTDHYVVNLIIFYSQLTMEAKVAIQEGHVAEHDTFLPQGCLLLNVF
jgi:hypothetical protein